MDYPHVPFIKRIRFEISIRSGNEGNVYIRYVQKLTCRELNYDVVLKLTVFYNLLITKSLFLDNYIIKIRLETSNITGR